jgi:hypothetical protein
VLLLLLPTGRAFPENKVVRPCSEAFRMSLKSAGACANVGAAFGTVEIALERNDHKVWCGTD